jgi:hypothetical protein
MRCSFVQRVTVGTLNGGHMPKAKQQQTESFIFKFSAEAERLIIAAGAAMDAVDTTLAECAEQLHDDGIKALWLQRQYKDEDGKLIDNKDNVREDMIAGMDLLLVSRMSEHDQKLLRTDSRLMVGKGNQQARDMKKMALGRLEKQRKAIINKLVALERTLEKATSMREQAMLAAWIQKYLDDGINTTIKKPKHLVNLRCFEVVDILKTAKESIKKLTKIVG